MRKAVTTTGDGVAEDKQQGRTVRLRPWDIGVIKEKCRDKEAACSCIRVRRAECVDRFPEIFHQLLGGIGNVQPHDALLCIPVAEEIDAPVPDEIHENDGMMPVTSGGV